jgi:hypothetical protein
MFVAGDRIPLCELDCAGFIVSLSRFFSHDPKKQTKEDRESRKRFIGKSRPAKVSVNSRYFLK